MRQTVQPVSSGERITSLDVLRGFSLLGIFLVNMISFHSPYAYYNPYEWWQYGERTVYAWIDVLVQGSFYPIFAMMFGYGLVIMQQRMAAKDMSFWKISTRRMAVLLGIGMIHAFFIWHGDILITYAICGLVLLAFLKLSGRLLMWLGLGLYFLPQLLLSSLFLFLSLMSIDMGDFYSDIVSIQSALDTYAEGTYAQIIQQNYADWQLASGLVGLPLQIMMIVPLMMIGAGASKLQWLQKAKQSRKKWAWIFAVGAVAGIGIKLLPVIAEPTISYMYIQDMLGGPILGASYAALIVLLMSYPAASGIMKPLAYAGRMSMTIYLSQSIISVCIFYSFGLGLYGDMALSTGTLLASAIYVIQVMIAGLWFKKFRYGPVEKVWRFLTYGRKALAKPVHGQSE